MKHIRQLIMDEKQKTKEETVKEENTVLLKEPKSLMIVNSLLRQTCL